jgi:hypothetical protein
MAIVLILFAGFICMWIVALAGLVALIFNMFWKDFFYSEVSPSHKVRITRII